MRQLPYWGPTFVQWPLNLAVIWCCLLGECEQCSVTSLKTLVFCIYNYWSVFCKFCWFCGGWCKELGRICCHTAHRLNKSNKMQQYADIYLLVNYSTCFGRPSLPSSGVHKTVVAASGTDHTIWGASFFKHDQIRTVLIWSHLRKLAPQIVWSAPEAATTVLCTPSGSLQVVLAKVIHYYILFYHLMIRNFS